MCGTNTWSTMTNRLVGERKLTEIMTNHFRLDLHLVEGFTIMDSYDGSDHVRKHDHVPQMRFDHSWFLVWRSFFLRFSQLYHQSHGFHFQPTCKSAPCPGMHNFHKLLTGEVQQLVQVFTAKHELPESSFLLQFHLSCFVRHLL